MTGEPTAGDAIADWPEESREAARQVIEARGEPDELTPTRLVWNEAHPWKRLIAARTFFQHDFPTPHTDSVESVIDYQVPLGMFNVLAEFDGSVIAERTAGELSARCHDEQANLLALNLAHDIVSSEKTAEEARIYYAKEFLDFRRGLPTPYMDGLRFTPNGANSGDRDWPSFTDDDLTDAEAEGERRT